MMLLCHVLVCNLTKPVRKLVDHISLFRAGGLKPAQTQHKTTMHIDHGVT